MLPGTSTFNLNIPNTVQKAYSQQIKRVRLPLYLHTIVATSTMAHRKARVEMFEPGQNVSLWLHRINTERQLRLWPDVLTVAEAEASLLRHLRVTSLYASASCKQKLWRNLK